MIFSAFDKLHKRDLWKTKDKRREENEKMVKTENVPNRASCYDILITRLSNILCMHVFYGQIYRIVCGADLLYVGKCASLAGMRRNEFNALYKYYYLHRKTFIVRHHFVVVAYDSER